MTVLRPVWSSVSVQSSVLTALGTGLHSTKFDDWWSQVLKQARPKSCVQSTKDQAKVPAEGLSRATGPGQITESHPSMSLCPISLTAPTPIRLLHVFGQATSYHSASVSHSGPRVSFTGSLEAVTRITQQNCVHSPLSSPSSSPFLITMNSLRTILPVQKFKSLCFECSQRAQFSAVQKSTSQSVVHRALGLPDLFYRLFQGTTILMRMLSSCPLLRVQQHLQA